MKVIFEQPIPEGYITIEHAASMVNRKPRTIYDWIKLDGLRTYKRSNEPVLVHAGDVLKIDKLRAQGRRRKPRLPTL